LQIVLCAKRKAVVTHIDGGFLTAGAAAHQLTTRDNWH